MSDDPMPDRSMAHREKIDWMIETAGWAFEPVGARVDTDPPRPPYGYTIGLEQAYGFPEVVVFGMTPANARGMVGLVVDLLATGVVPPVGPPFLGLLDNELRCALLPVDVEAHAEDFEAAAEWFGRDEFRVVQLAWPDRNGWLPWESGFEARLRFAQPVIGSLADV